MELAHLRRHVLVRSVRAGEWVVLAYVVFAVLRMAVLGIWDFKSGLLIRDDFLVACMCVAIPRLALANKRTPWPKDDLQSRLFKWALPIFVLPGILVCVARPDRFPAIPREGGAFVPVVLALHVYFTSVAFVVGPLVVLYFATALHLKKNGELQVFVLFRDSGAAVVRELREWFPSVAITYAYVLLVKVQEHPFFADQDATLAAIDRALFFGHDPLELCQRIVWAPLSEWLSACYTFYLPLIPLVLGWMYAKPGRGPFRETSFAVTAVLATGYVLYMIVPAKGPLFTKTFDVKLDLFYVGWLKDQLMDKTRVPRDCFPSLHTAASVILLWSSYRHARRLFWVLLPIVASIPVACVYLRYHYVIDVLAGIALVIAVAWLTTRLAAKGAFAGDEDEGELSRADAVR